MGDGREWATDEGKEKNTTLVQKKRHVVHTDGGPLGGVKAWTRQASAKTQGPGKELANIQVNRLLREMSSGCWQKTLKDRSGRCEVTVLVR